MCSRSDLLERQREIPVRELRIVGPGGVETVRRTAACPLRERPAPLGVCEACPRKVSLCIDPGGHRSVVRCQVPGDAGEPAGEGAPAEDRVSSVMSWRVVCVQSDLPERAVLMVLVEQGISGMPVVDGAGRPVGVISATDLLRDQYDIIEDEEDELLPHWVRGAVEQHRVGGRGGRRPGRTAADLMTPSAISVREDVTVREAAALMARHHIHRLPVVAADGMAVGILSSLDLVRWLASVTSSQAGAAPRPSSGSGPTGAPTPPPR
jgi:CBS domain-containing protein